jgi:anhydro-N-acetylmuramic acid kinase
MKPKLYKVIGLMSGTSVDGIDAALMETDGLGWVRPLAFMTTPFEHSFRSRLRQFFSCTNRDDLEVLSVERELTELHAEVVTKFLHQLNGKASGVDLIGFHGQTLFHDPAKRISVQIGDGALLAKMTNIPVVNDFRSADMKAGGTGAPLVPLYHRALAAKLPKPVAIVNIGGVSNISWIGGDHDDELLAFDVGPGNAMIDDWILHHTGQAYDAYGLLASSGVVQQKIVDSFLAQKFFKQKPPKSMDRNAFKRVLTDDVSVHDGAATLTMITARSIAESLRFMPQKPTHLYVTGGGRLNNTLMRWILDLANIPVSPVDDLNWSGDGLEAEAFAYLAVRSRLGLPLSVPGTTGVSQPTTGGTLHVP